REKMTENEPPFPELVAEVAEMLPVACRTPLFVVAYKQDHGGFGARWKLFFPLEFGEVDHPKLREEMQQLQSKGWTHITVMRLPATGPWAEGK
ncbi:MAG: hypothetical protein Q7R45_04820, partial [Sulfuricaulis sp.]|nr:hypothetical protein [Sulfuricaulis sp.]